MKPHRAQSNSREPERPEGRASALWRSSAASNLRLVLVAIALVFQILSFMKLSGHDYVGIPFIPGPDAAVPPGLSAATSAGGAAIGTAVLETLPDGTTTFVVADPSQRNGRRLTVVDPANPMGSGGGGGNSAPRGPRSPGSEDAPAPSPASGNGGGASGDFSGGVVGSPIGHNGSSGPTGGPGGGEGGSGGDGGNPGLPSGGGGGGGLPNDPIGEPSAGGGTGCAVAGGCESAGGTPPREEDEVIEGNKDEVVTPPPTSGEDDPEPLPPIEPKPGTSALI